jgi:hypothetical protein
MKKKDQIYLEEAYQQVMAAANQGNEIYFISEQDANQIYLIPAIAYAMNAAAIRENPNLLDQQQGNNAFNGLRNFDELVKQNPQLGNAMAVCQSGLKNYFKGTPPKLRATQISDLNQSEAFGVGYHKGKRGFISYIGFQTSFWGSVYMVAEQLNGDNAFRNKYQYFTKDGYYDKLTPEEARRVTEKPAEQQAPVAQQTPVR